MKLCQLLIPFLLAPAAAFDYSLSGGGDLFLTDISTSISGIVTLFTGEDIAVAVEGIEWEDGNTGTDTELIYKTLVNGKEMATGSVSLEGVGRELPTSIDAGTIKVDKGGRYKVEVIMTVDDSTGSAYMEYEAYGAGVSIIPLLVVLVLAVTTHMVEFALFSAIFVGGCMVQGNANDGFKVTLDDYILNALANVDHGYVYLFTLFLSGLVGMFERSGGMFGFTKDVGLFAKTARTGQAACFSVGIFVFFDDYANVLLAGKTLRPLLDLLSVSREKLAFIVDATAAPIASISPVSSWVGFEVGLIQEQIDRIIELEGTEDIGIDTSGFAVFLQSIKYRYYPIFMIILMMALIYSGRDFGSMLIAERKTRVYKRTDGGDGGTMTADEHEAGNPNKPREDQPLRSWNMVFPVLMLIFYIFYLLIKTGVEEGVKQNLMDKIEGSDSYASLLWGTMAAVIVTMIFYGLQPVKDGESLAPWDVAAWKDIFLPGKAKEEDGESKARVLMTPFESVDGFLFGMGRVFPALIVLTLAWASGSVMVAVGADRLFSSWIVGGVSPESLPTLSFLISLFMALATGTSWGTMSILFPLIMVPSYYASNGDEQLFYAVIAGVLSGSVAGDHMSPISDTTVLTALACDCNLLTHVGTQAPYVVFTVLVSIILGTIPIGFDSWPNIIGILLGTCVVVAFVYGVCVPVMSPTGRFDIFTELYIKYKKDSPLLKLKEDTAKASEGTAELTPGEEGAIELDKVSQDLAGEEKKAVPEDGEVMADPAEDEDYA